MTKRILITGKSSYIGNQLAKYLNKEPQKYSTVRISVRDGNWKEMDFSVFDAIVHVAGIAHIKETKENKDIYYKVNRDLAYEIAKKAKKEGIKQFIFLSSMSVYGVEIGVISKNTPLKPNNAYGKSKLEAEKLIQELAEKSFNISVVRPPMVYGRGSKGNYSRLAKLALNTPVFPSIDNKRSMIYIDNLSEFIRQLIDNCSKGVFLPQNAEYTNTSEMVKTIAEVNGKKIRMTKFFNPFLRFLKISTINKVFGDLIYEQSISEYKNEYRVINMKKSIEVTEGNYGQ